MPSIIVVYIVTAVFSIAIAFLLFNLAKLSGQAKIVVENKKRVDAYLPADVSIEKSLQKTIVEGINEFVAAPSQREEAGKKLLDVFNRELQSRVEAHIGELSQKYEKIIKEEKQNEEIAWKKYNKVLTDKRRTEAVIRSIAEGLVVVDEQGKVIMMNPAAEKLLGVSRKNKIGAPITESLREEQLLSLASGNDDKKDGQREIELISQQDETKKILRASSAVIENESGQTVGMVSVLSDITKQKELDRLKASFVANVSHELRTPLIAIDKSLSLIMNNAAGELSPPQKQFLTIAERNLKRLNLLINDLLDLSKLESGRTEFKRQLSQIENVINESADSFNNWTQTKSITIERRIQKGLPDVNMDPNRIIQVLTNLIGNAIKFTPNNGKITVQAVLDNSKKEVKVSVADTGIGIARENLAKVFDKFYQVGERVSSDMFGTGIGLSIAKEIVELHGGRIWAESERGSGATFIFALPLS
jgi:PAS domain S-box-containing protein